jgi:hypothetical protein
MFSSCVEFIATSGGVEGLVAATSRLAKRVFRDSMVVRLPTFFLKPSSGAWLNLSSIRGRAELTTTNERINVKRCALGIVT